MLSCGLLLIRSCDDVPRACRDAGAFLAFQRARRPTRHGEQDTKLVGIWLDPLMVALPPEVWGSVSISGSRPFQIRESVGVDGIWELYWLDADYERETVSLDTMREMLVSALIGERPPGPYSSAPQFVPVFDENGTHPSMISQMQRLREVFPGRIENPLTWDRLTNTFATLAGVGDCKRSL